MLSSCSTIPTGEHISGRMSAHSRTGAASGKQVTQMQTSIRLRQFRDWLVEWRPREIVEAILGVAMVTALDLLIPQRWGLEHLDLYTLWVVVLAIAARYGAPAGYIAGGSAALAFLLVLVIQTDANQPLAPNVEIQPFLLFTSGVM